MLFQCSQRFSNHWRARSVRAAAAENYAVAVFNAVFADDIKAVEAAATLPQADDTPVLAALGDSAGPFWKAIEFTIAWESQNRINELFCTSVVIGEVICMGFRKS